MATLALKNLVKIYDQGNVAVEDFNLEVKDGEFIVLVGPSGCGKSTTLRMIAGLEEITKGKFYIDDVDVTDKAAKDRDIAMVFQNYALYAHMTVYQNMAFSLMIKKVKPDIIHERVMAAADILGLKEQLNKKPKQLSGGQRQRVAVGRAIVRDPKVFLFDEPLSNLDARLRGVMRREIKLLHHRLKTTMIYVTHDQIEALTLADRIVIMNNGKVQQIGTPLEVYQDPANHFVASFIGTPPMNFLHGTIKNGHYVAGNLSIKLPKIALECAKDYLDNDRELILGVRPEHIKEGKDVLFEVEIIEHLGAATLVHCTADKNHFVFKLQGWSNTKPHDKIHLGIDWERACFFDKASGNRIRLSKTEEKQ